MLDPRFVLLAAAIDLSGVLVYARDTLRGNTQPNRVTWALWTILPLITFAAQLGEGIGWSAILTLALAVGPAIVVLASFLNKQAYWKVSQFDWVCGALSVLAVVLWIVTRDGVVAIALSLLADILAGLPTIIKSYRAPHTEHGSAYIVGIFSGGITLMTLDDWSFASYSFPLYIMLFCLLLVVLIRFPKLRFPGRGVA